jgi:quinol-cytochrome oxidoreductase complex cytochrome b subunit
MAERQVPFSTHITKMMLYGLLASGLVATLSFAVQAPLTALGNLQIEVSKPDWYLLWIYTIENYFGLEPVTYVLTAAMIIILIAPALDRSPETDPRKRKFMMTLLMIAIVLFVALTITAALLPPKAHIA